MTESGLTDEMQEYVAVTHCFTAAEGMLGQHHTHHTPEHHIDPRLHQVVIAVVVMRNGESFVGYTVCRKGVEYNFQMAAEKAKAKAFRKLKDHLDKQLVSTLL